MRTSTVAVLLVLLFSSTAAAQTFSPGKLSRAHAKIEKLGNYCGQCHDGGDASVAADCLSCHTEIASRLKAKRGYHARVKGQSCGACHAEHRGRNAPLIRWPAGRDRFNHDLAGWGLKGSHKKVDCKSCHTPPAVRDPAVRRVVKEGGRETWLGLSTDCASCHHDEHRGQLGKKCAQCHSVQSDFHAVSFDHNRHARYRLTGRHLAVDCRQCHAAKKDPAFNAKAFPRPRANTFARYRPMRFSSCKSCHADPHKPSRGVKCSSCHVTQGWRQVAGTTAAGSFHDETDFPLKGGHVGVECKMCHGPFKDNPRQRKPVFKGTVHARCDDCHIDAHVGQLTPAEDNDCRRCHDEQGFLPVRFSADAHADTRYPLEGAHRAVACGDCHLQDKTLAASVAKEDAGRMRARGRPVLVSPARLKLWDVTGACETCHTDRHGGQFSSSSELPPRSCADCHVPRAFDAVVFDHDASRFPLEGKHAKADCASCHRPASAAPSEAASVVRYRPLERECADCHRDPHYGQFASRNDCARCHSSERFADSRFSHDDPAMSRFPLEGKHASVACEACHPLVDVGGEKPVQKFADVPMDCEGCHAPQHQGRFDRYAPP